MLRLIFIVTFLIWTSSVLSGQNVDMDQPVTLNYRNVRMGDALQNISTRYHIYFSYSKHYVPIEKRVNIKVTGEPLSLALDKLFVNTNVIYANIGDQIVLKKGNKPIKKEVEKNIYGSIKPPLRAIDQQEQEEVLTASNRPHDDISEVPVLSDYNFGLPEVFSETPEEEIDTERYYVEAPEPEKGLTTAQVSIVPDFGTNMEEAKNRTNNFSLNVFGGENGGVNGVEVGGFFNKVRNDVNGVQVAGLFNAVGGNVGPAKIFDGELEEAKGVQIAGLVNVAKNVNAIQIGGLMNVNGGSFRGLQISGLLNKNKGDADGAQLSGLFNLNGGDAGIQFAGIANYAEDVRGTQLSAFFNRAKKVDGTQFALINVCDTVSGASIGLLNFVKKGYNQIEIGASETMYAQLSLRFGSRRFYNIFQFGAQFETQRAYSLGYGIGTTILDNSDNWQWNTELVLSHLIQDDKWFKNLSLMGEWRVTAECKLSRWASFYLGPTIHLSVFDPIKRLSNPEPIAYESTVPIYTLFDNKNRLLGSRDIKAWIGFRAGFRFGRN